MAANRDALRARLDKFVWVDPDDDMFAVFPTEDEERYRKDLHVLLAADPHGYTSRDKWLVDEWCELVDGLIDDPTLVADVRATILEAQCDDPHKVMWSKVVARESVAERDLPDVRDRLRTIKQVVCLWEDNDELDVDQIAGLLVDVARHMPSRYPPGALEHMWPDRSGYRAGYGPEWGRSPDKAFLDGFWGEPGLRTIPALMRMCGRQQVERALEQVTFVIAETDVLLAEIMADLDVVEAATND